MKTQFDKETKAKKVQKIKKDLPHLVASVPLTSQRHLSFKIAQTLSTVASVLLL
jgi:hypothetical protein